MKHLTSEERKQHPVYSGFMVYFPDAIMAIANHSWKANEKHNPGTDVHWDRSKSGDEKDAMARHMVDMAMGMTVDEDGLETDVATAWRALANLQKRIENQF